jgi:hypothetical protein
MNRLSNLSLSDYLFKLSKLVDQTKNRIGILEEENQYLRNEYTKVSKVNIHLNNSCIQLDEKIKLYQESSYVPTPSKTMASTKDSRTRTTD